MALILCLETSSVTCSVALFDNDTLVRKLEIAEAQAHASKLSVLIKQIFADKTLSIQQLQAVAISAGPGSYTGLRIGTSTAKGICYALNIPLISVPTLEFLARHTLHQTLASGLYCPMIDAKRMEVYCQIFNENGGAITEVEAKIIDESSFIELLDNGIVFFSGDGSGKCKSLIRHRNARFVEGIFPSADLMGKPAFEKWKLKQFEDVVAFTPMYHKDFVAKKAQPVF